MRSISFVRLLFVFEFSVHLSSLHRCVLFAAGYSLPLATPYPGLGSNRLRKQTLAAGAGQKLK